LVGFQRWGEKYGLSQGLHETFFINLDASFLQLEFLHFQVLFTLGKLFNFLLERWSSGFNMVDLFLNDFLFFLL